jgi:hypothetical protein
MRNSMQQLTRYVVTGALLGSVAACAIAPPRTAVVPSLRYEIAPVAPGSPFLVRKLRFDPPSTVDRSVGLGGTIGQTVNEVVPIPGTDMIRAGAVPEGSLFQNSFRNATADAAGRAGTSPTGATIIFRVDRP